MRSKLLDLDLAGRAMDIVFRYAEELRRDIYLLAFLEYVIFTEE